MINNTKHLGAKLAEAYFELLQSSEVCSFEDFEGKAIELGHFLMCRAMEIALKRFDDVQLKTYAPKLKVHDIRRRTLVTEIGSVSFKRRVCRDVYNNPVIPLDEYLDIAHGARISPGAFSFLIEAGAEVSYVKAARLLSRKSNARISATTVMRAFRLVGDLLEEKTTKQAHDLYELGIAPPGGEEAKEICMEADGTWVSIQNQDTKAEIKALVAYRGKEAAGKKTNRVSPVRFGCIADSGDFWTQGISVVGERFDLSKVERCHLGTDGAPWCKSGKRYLKGSIETTSHLDPFHVNRAIGRCFANKADAKGVLECIWLGDVAEAIGLLKAYVDEGIARKDIAEKVCTYLSNNMSIISIDGPSLGTMESENQHLYKSRMDSVPCAWSIKGASDMARIRSTIYSKIAIPKYTRENSLSEAKKKHRRKKVEKSFIMKNYMPKESVGCGYEPMQATLSNIGHGRQARYVSGLLKDQRLL